MNSLLFLAVAAGVMLLAAARNNTKVRAALQKHSAKRNILPQAISMLILAAQLNELLKVVDHISVVNISASLFLLAIVTAAKSGTEGEVG